jgi:hypothetical protein
MEYAFEFLQVFWFVFFKFLKSLFRFKDFEINYFLAGTLLEIF